MAALHQQVTIVTKDPPVHSESPSNTDTMDLRPSSSGSAGPKLVPKTVTVTPPPVGEWSSCTRSTMGASYEKSVLSRLDTTLPATLFRTATLRAPPTPCARSPGYMLSG
eukprot:scaffold8535_cov43-Prasinocladus_malaysianus.AAC.2